MRDTFKLVDYFDVWGNKEEGWDVNDVRTLFDDLHIEDDATDEDIIKYLYDIEYLASDDPARYEVVWSDDMFCEIFDAENQCPICRLEKMIS